VKELRRRWCRAVARVDPRRLVFVDESGVNTAMTRARGRAPKGQRVHSAVPHGDWKTVTMLGAIRASGMAAAATAPFPTDTDLFRLFVTHALVPALRRGDVVVWDGLAPHKAAGLKEAIEGAGAELMPLPPYSPDFSPNEPCWSKVKEIVRAAEPRDERAIGDATARAFAAVTPDDARGCFRHCGYVVH
jgi:transposase